MFNPELGSLSKRIRNRQTTKADAGTQREGVKRSSFDTNYSMNNNNSQYIMHRGAGISRNNQSLRNHSVFFLAGFTRLCGVFPSLIPDVRCLGSSDVSAAYNALPSNKVKHIYSAHLT